ncbi:MAG: PLP-dependent aminotransferase family protein [bacterium]
MDTIWLPELVAGEGPKYLALARALRDAIGTGELPEGAQLPTVRDLAWRLSVTPGTVSRAYQIATQQGLLQATVGRGTFVAARKPRLGPPLPAFAERFVLADTNRIDLRSPLLPEVGQTAAIGEALRRISVQNGVDWLDYPSQSEEVDLREQVCDWLGERVLGPLGPQDIMLSHGGQNSIGLILDCCLRGDRPVVLTEDLSYPGFRYAARAARAEVIGVELDAEGMRPDALETACRRYGPQVVCLTPAGQNPTTAQMSAQRMVDIVSIAQRYNLQIVEDECYPAMTGGSPTLRALAPDRVWYVGSLSKTVSAALRFGYVICPTGMGDAGRLTAQHSFFALSRLVTALSQDLFASGAAVAIRDRVMVEYSERLQLVVNHLGSFDLAWQQGLPFVWLNMPLGWRASTFAQQAEEAGVLMRSADQYAMVHGRAPNAVRLALGGNNSQAELVRGLDILCDLLARPPTDMAV